MTFEKKYEQQRQLQLHCVTNCKAINTLLEDDIKGNQGTKI